MVRLYTFNDEVTWDRTYENIGLVPYITDLETDNFGHVWATVGDGFQHGVIAKFTHDLVLLDIFGNDASDDGDFCNPVALTNVGGILGVGDIMVVEEWADNSGLQHYFIGTDFSDLAVTLFDNGDNCEAAIFFRLFDYGYLSIKIFDSQGQLVRNLSPGARVASGWKYYFWDGRDDSGIQVENDYYTIEVADTSAYVMIEDWQPANVVVDSLRFYYCDLGFCSTGLGATHPPADCNADGSLDIDDVVCMIQYLFSGGTTWCLPYSIDAYMTGQGDIDDVVYLINYLYSGGPSTPTCEEWVTYNGSPACE